MSHIRYGISVWGGASIKPLQKVLKKAVRYIESTHYTAHTDPIFAKLNILKVEDIWKQTILKIALENINNKDQSKMFTIQEPVIATRRHTTPIFAYPTLSKIKYRKQLAYQLPDLWNKELHIFYNQKTKKALRDFKSVKINAYKKFNCNNSGCYPCRKTASLLELRQL